jgi:hypothetical protein
MRYKWETLIIDLRKNNEKYIRLKQISDRYIKSHKDILKKRKADYYKRKKLRRIG